MRILILEDDGTRTNNFIEMLHRHDLDIIENAYRAIDLLEDNVYDLILLDHDLGQENGTGSAVSGFLRHNPQNDNNNATIIIHSWNTPAALGMQKDLPGAYFAPFNSEDFYDLITGIMRNGIE